MREKTVEKIMGAAFIGLLAGFSLMSLLLSDQKVSKTERRSLAQSPEASAEAIWDGSYMKNVETYFLDQIAGRDTFRTLKAEFETRLYGKSDSNGYYRADGVICKLERELNESNVNRASNGFQNICESYFEDARIYVSVIPDKNFFGAGIRNFPSMDYGKLNEIMKENMRSSTFINISDLLSLEDYYKTDIHWKQEQIQPVADRLLKEMGALDQRQRTEYREESVTISFYGSYEGASAFLTGPDTVKILTNDEIESSVLYDYENKQERPVYARELAEGTDAYDVFLWGPRALLTVKDKEQENGRKLLVFRDSFGSSLAPFLLPGYSEVTLIDLRYVSAEYAMSLLDTESYEDILFLYSSAILNHSESLKLLK